MSDSSDTVPFSRVVADEIEQINKRRSWLRQQGLSSRPDVVPATDGSVNDVVALALSGGGIRSAATCLGVLQALNHYGLLNRIDYLSTVSGGGYIGSSLTSTMATTGRFVFGSSPVVPEAGKARQLAAEISDTPAVGHIRNYSNYLLPNGLPDVVTAAAVFVRGLVASVSAILPTLLLLAAITIALNPYRSMLTKSDVFGYDLSRYFIDKFSVTLFVAFIGVALFFSWAIRRSFIRDAARLTEVGGWLPTLAGVYLISLVAVAFVEFQPFVIDGMFQSADEAAGQGGDLSTVLLTNLFQIMPVVAVPVAAAVLFFQGQLGNSLKAGNLTSDRTTRFVALLAKVAVWIAAAALPLFIWVVYVQLSYWGIINNRSYVAALPGIEGLHTPRWLIKLATATHQFLWDLLWGQFSWEIRLPRERSTVADWINERLDFVYQRPLVTFYLVVGLFLYAVSRLLSANANSLHRLYRDRIAKAFLFNPDSSRTSSSTGLNVAGADRNQDFEALELPLAALASEHAPYHLINTALNIQGSALANRRRRNADFFVMSPLYVGSEATGYQRTSEFQQIAPELDLAMAVAISAAAASPNMGSSSIDSLRPTLALLNVRMGYWLKNPKYLADWRRAAAKPFLPTFRFRADANDRGEIGGGTEASPKRVMARQPFHLWSEMTGRLSEHTSEIYLTDGGHIENLAIYELLRRRCRLIIAVDAEADAAMYFGSLIRLQRYARIDYGFQIQLPRSPVRNQTRACMSHNAGKDIPLEPAHGPHVAIGTIDYGNGEIGYLVYIKSSLTGDENDYIQDYARRYDRFPHETTGDQFFTEEQFEVYRALGFHMLHGFLNGNDLVVAADGSTKAEITSFSNTNVPSIRAVREYLDLTSEIVSPAAG